MITAETVRKGLGRPSIQAPRERVVGHDGRVLSTRQNELRKKAIAGFNDEQRRLERKGQLIDLDIVNPIHNIGGFITEDEDKFSFGKTYLRRYCAEDEKHNPVNTVELTIGPEFDDQQAIDEIVRQVFDDDQGISVDSYQELEDLLDWRQLNFALRFEHGAKVSNKFQYFVQTHVQSTNDSDFAHGRIPRVSDYKSKIIIMISKGTKYLDVVYAAPRIVQCAGAMMT